MSKNGILCATALSAFLAAATFSEASASTLDFTEVGATGLVGLTVINLSNATLTSFGTDFFIGAPGAFGESNLLGIACATAPTNCETDWQIDFSSDVHNLSMGSFGVEVGDSVTVSAFLGASLLGNVVVTTQTLLDLSAFGAIDRLFFDDNSTAAGIGFGDFKFDVAAVPLPASLPLLASGLGLFGYMARRRREQKPTAVD